jgi:hypothetical protein
MVSELFSTGAPVFHGWEARIDNHTELGKLLFSTDECCVFNALVVKELISGVDHLATFHNIICASSADRIISENALDRLKDIEITSVKWGYSNFETFVKRIKLLKGEEKDGKSPESVLEAASDDARMRIVRLIENGAVAAKTIICKMPIEVRGPAADIFNVSWQSAIAFFGRAWAAIKMIVAAPEQYLQDALYKLDRTLDVTKTASEIAMVLICKVFESSCAVADSRSFGNSTQSFDLLPVIS